MRFEWDPTKARLNIARHGIAFSEAITVFGDPLASTIEDREHGDQEPREITLGMSDLHRLVVVYHVRRGTGIRIIGARTPTRHERRTYQDGAGS
jgi:uncharacterized DUF497 family protein